MYYGPLVANIDLFYDDKVVCTVGCWSLSCAQVPCVREHTVVCKMNPHAQILMLLQSQLRTLPSKHMYYIAA